MRCVVELLHSQLKPTLCPRRKQTTIREVFILVIHPCYDQRVSERRCALIRIRSHRLTHPGASRALRMARTEWHAVPLSSKGCGIRKQYIPIDVAVWAPAPTGPLQISRSIVGSRCPCQFGLDNYIMLCACRRNATFRPCSQVQFSVTPTRL